MSSTLVPSTRSDIQLGLLVVCELIDLHFVLGHTYTFILACSFVINLWMISRFCAAKFPGNPLSVLFVLLYTFLIFRAQR